MKPSESPYGVKIADVEYKDIDFVWVSSHYDFHRDGICTFRGQLCRFSCCEEIADEAYTCSHEDDEETCRLCDGSLERIACSIHALSTSERRWWLRRKWLFEKCVSHHWSYPTRPEEYRRTASGVMVLKRNLLRRMLFCLYYLPHGHATKGRWRWFKHLWGYS